MTVGYATISEELPCQRKPDNRHDPFTVVVVMSLITVRGQQYVHRQGASRIGYLLHAIR